MMSEVHQSKFQELVKHEIILQSVFLGPPLYFHLIFRMVLYLIRVDSYQYGEVTYNSDRVYRDQIHL